MLKSYKKVQQTVRFGGIVGKRTLFSSFFREKRVGGCEKEEEVFRVFQ